MTTQAGEQVPFVEEILRQLHATVSDLETHQVWGIHVYINDSWHIVVVSNRTHHGLFDRALATHQGKSRRSRSSKVEQSRKCGKRLHRQQRQYRHRRVTVVVTVAGDVLRCFAVGVQGKP